MIGLNMPYLLAITAAVLQRVQCAPLCLTGDFDSQMQHILDTQRISEPDPANIISRVLDDVQTTLNKRWQGFKLTPFGSLTTDLGAKTSDVDISLQLQNSNHSDSYVLQEAGKLFKKQPALYSDIDVMVKPKYARFSFFHIPSQRKVDLVFRNGEGAVHESKLVRYYFNLDDRYMPLARFLIYWFKIHGLTGDASSTLQSYGLYLMTIFYLQQKNLVPPGYLLQVDATSNYVGIWDMGFNELPYSSTNTENLHQLLGGFFKYYSEFNFDQYIVSPFTGRPIPRNAFSDIDNFPEEYTLYNSTLKHTMQLAIQNDLNMNTDVCIQDIFEHSSNAGQRLSHELATKLKYLLKSVAAIFEVLPSDSILRAMLVMDGHNETVYNTTMNEINEQNCIEIT